jgi:hypothetical protein
MNAGMCLMNNNGPETATGLFWTIGANPVEAFMLSNSIYNQNRLMDFPDM